VDPVGIGPELEPVEPVELPGAVELQPDPDPRLVVAGPKPMPVDPGSAVVAVTPVELELVELEFVEPYPVEPVELVAAVVDVTAVVAVADVAVSGETHPAGGDAGPYWPGMSTLPAQPKSESVTVWVWVAPSLKDATDTVCRMYPASWIETLTVVPV